MIDAREGQIVIKGTVHIFGDNINTDDIIPARYLVTADAAELAKHIFADIDPEIARSISQGDIIVAGYNFGCGSSREHAPLALKAAGINCVIARSFARIFFRNAVNTGLAIVTMEKPDTFCQGDIATVDIEKGIVKNITQKTHFSITPFPPFLQEIIHSGGLMATVKKQP